jgi:hypothetical protein
VRGALLFLFGSGWGIVWNLVLLGVLLPLAVLVWWMWRFDPQGGPQGGEAALALLFLVYAILFLAGAVHSVWWALNAPDPGVMKYLKAVGISLAAWIAFVVVTVPLANLGASTSASLATRRAATAGLALLLVLGLGGHLAWLWRLRR